MGKGRNTVEALRSLSTTGEFGIEKISMLNKVGNPTHIDTLLEVFNHAYSAGVMHGCDISVNVDGTVSFTSGYAMLRPSADAHTELYSVEVPAQVNLPLTDNSVNYIYLDYNAGTPQFMASTSVDSFNCQDKCITYVAVREGTNVNYVNVSEQSVDSMTKNRRLFLDFNRFIHTQGGTKLSEVGTRNISVTAGSFYFMITKIPHSAFDTSGTDTFDLYYRDGLGGWSVAPDLAQVTNDKYDNGSGTLATLANNKFGTTWFYVINDNPSYLVALHGTQEYANQAEAENASPPTSVPPIIDGLGVLIGFVVYEKGAINFNNVLSAFSQSFTPAQATDHNGLSGLQGGAINEYYHLSATEHANKVLKNVTNTFTTAQRSSVTTANTGSFDLNATNKFSCTPTASALLTFTNYATIAQSGSILLVNTTPQTITLDTMVKARTGLATELSTAGTYLIGYESDGAGSVYLTSSEALA